MYNFSEIEKKVQDFWEKNKTFKVENPNVEMFGQNISSRPKFYALDMFPYPSGEGLHVGHPKGYTANDIVSRYKNAKGYNVLHPMGWDAFGLPAENYAIKTGTHPAVTTEKNVINYRRQIKSLGFSYDWDREINTTDPKYYKWTQWIFLKMFEAGLAYEQDLPINYCPSCKTGLANEEVLANNTCDRCQNPVEKRKIKQWVLAITKYADRLEKDVDKLDWPKGIKDMQKNWIGRSEGCEFEMKKYDGFEYSVPNEEEYNEIIKIREEEKTNSYNFSREQFIIAKKDGKLAGFIRVYKNREHNELGALYVKEEFRGFKLGYKLISHIIDYSKETEFYMDCKKSLVDYYKNIGFEILNKPLDFQLQKIKDINQKYNINDNEQEILEKTLFMKFTKKEDLVENIKVYTTRIDTVFSMAFVVIAPDHPKIMDFITEEQKKFCFDYVNKSKNESEQERTNEGKEKTGVFTGSYVINPYNNEKVPLWIGDFVLGHYGTGAVFGDAHDERDFVFAKKYGIDLKISISPKTENLSEIESILNFEKCFTQDGILVNSGEFDGLTSAEARKVLTEYAEQNGFGSKKVNYKLRDWLFSRQRYWGEPIPLIHLDEKDLEKLEIIENLEQAKDNNKAYVLAKNPSYTVIENSLSPENISKLSNFGNVEILETSERRGKFFNVTVSLETENEFVEFLKSNLIKKSKQDGGDWYADSMRTSNKIVFNGKVFEIKNVKDLKQFKNYGLSVGVPEKELEIGFINPEFGEYLVIGGKIISKIYDGLYTKIICDYNLPLTLPEVEKYEPAGDGQSPLANVDSFVNVKLADNLNGKRETNTMPQWGGSCWYYLRFMDSENKDELVNSDIEKYWGQVDSYVGGAEHAVLHLLYARFWHKFLFDIGVVSHDEPFQKLRNQGLILAYSFQRENGSLVANDQVEEKNGVYFEKSTGCKVKQVVAKMSKSLKNVVNPDDIVKNYGADTLRLYEMYMADFKDGAPWDTKSITGVKRFLEKVWTIFEEGRTSKENDNFTMKLLHKTIKKVGDDIEEYKFNTAIASMMILVNNGLPNDEKLANEWKEKLLIILHPFAPHICEELWGKLNNVEMFRGNIGINNKEIFCQNISTDDNGKNSIFFASWPKYDENMVKDDTVIIGVQVLGKLRGEIEIGTNEDKDSVLKKAKENNDVAKWLDGKNILKEIYVPGKIVNFVVK